MKKLLSGMIFLCLAAAGLFFALISRSDRPTRTQVVVNRQYDRIRALPTDTIAIDGMVHLLAACDRRVYALDQRAKVVHAVDEGRQPVVVAHHGRYFAEIPASFEADASGVYCFAANPKKIYHFPAAGGTPDSLSASGLPFSRGTRLTDSSMFIHHYDTAVRKAQFLLADYRGGGKGLRHLYDFPHVDDGGLASDGQTLSTENASTVIYYQYHNSVVYVWDSAGFRTFQTIDRTPAINTIIQNDGTWSISSKTHFINLDGATDGTFLYILSTAVSGGQATSLPEVDAYRLTDGSYAGSLPLPAFRKSPVRHIAAANGVLYASYQQHIIAYQLQFP